MALARLPALIALLTIGSGAAAMGPSPSVAVPGGLDDAMHRVLGATEGGLTTRDDFGWSVSLDGDRALVGVLRGAGVGPNTGSAYVFVRDGLGWALEAVLAAEDGEATDAFGSSVSLSGDRALVGASSEDSFGRTGNGAAYVFVRSGTTWSQEAKLASGNPESSGAFGSSVSLSGDRALIGAPLETTVGPLGGRAYGFVRSGSTWSLETTLLPLNPSSQDWFGIAVSLDGDRALVGAFLNGDAGQGSGAAYFFERGSSGWAEVDQVTASDANGTGWFGYAVSLDGDRALIGAMRDSENGVRTGSAYVFRWTGADWAEEAQLVAPDGADLDQFGHSVALSGDLALVGAPWDDDRGMESGSVYAFARSGSTWSLESKMTGTGDASHGASDELGYSVALLGETALVGAIGEGTDPVVDGAAYVFDRSPVDWALHGRLAPSGVDAIGLIEITGSAGIRYLGAPSAGLTVDDLAAQSLVRGVPGFYPAATPANLWTEYDPVANDWGVSSGTGEVVRPGHAFRWRIVDRVIGNPTVSAGVELPFVLATPRAPNEEVPIIELDTMGTRFNYLANPYATPLDLTGIAGWPGGANLSPLAPVWVWDAAARSWDDAPATIGPWEAFRVRSKGPRVNGGARTLRIPVEAAALDASPPSSAPRSPALAFALTGTDRAGRTVRDGALTVRFVPNATVGFEETEDVRKFQPPSEAYALVGARVDGAFVGYDVRPFESASIPLAVEARGTGTSFTLSWDASALPAGLPAVLVDLETGTEVDLRTRSAYPFAVVPRPAHAEVPVDDVADGTQATDRFVLQIGDRVAATEAGARPVALTGIAPNPSTGVSRVAFTIPEAGPVELTVVDVRGREVSVLASGAMSAGRHEVLLRSEELAGGIYVVRLEAAGTLVTRPVVVVR